MLDGKVVVVTGGAGLLGREFVKTVARNRGMAVIADLRYDEPREPREQIPDAVGPGETHAVLLDITSVDSIHAMLEDVHGRYGRIDAVVNGAYPRNGNYGRRFEDVTFEDFSKNVTTHLGGYFLVAQQTAIFFKEQGYGNIINMGSIYGVVAPRFEVYEGTSMTTPVEYAVIKAGIIHLTKYLAKYLQGSNIRVNCISPGGILDDQPEVFIERYNRLAATKGMLDRSDVNGTLLFLLSDMSRYITGQNIIVDDGWTL